MQNINKTHNQECHDYSFGNMNSKSMKSVAIDPHEKIYKLNFNEPYSNMNNNGSNHLFKVIQEQKHNQSPNKSASNPAISGWFNNQETTDQTRDLLSK